MSGVPGVGFRARAEESCIGNFVFHFLTRNGWGINDVVFPPKSKETILGIG